MSITKLLDTIAQERFGEFGFTTCTMQEQEQIINEAIESIFPSKK